MQADRGRSPPRNDEARPTVAAAPGSSDDVEANASILAPEAPTGKAMSHEIRRLSRLVEDHYARYTRTRDLAERVRAVEALKDRDRLLRFRAAVPQPMAQDAGRIVLYGNGCATGGKT